jgi:hypothetical protein
MALFFVALTLALYGAHHVGSKVGKSFGVGADRSQTSTLQAALLGLLALLLGFSLSIAEEHFSYRRILVIEDANAIGTAYLRIDGLPEGERPALRGLMRDYTDLRLLIAEQQLVSGDAVDVTAARTQELFAQMWARVMPLVRAEPQSQPLSLMVQALNEVNDSATRRYEARHPHVPVSILVVVGFIAMAAMAWVGIGYGWSSSKDRAVAVGVSLALLIAVPMVLVVDLDRPRRGIIQVSQRPIREARAAMND